MVIYLDLDDDNYVYGWGTDDGDTKVELDKNHDFFKTDYQGAYKFDGDLVFDEEKKKKLIEQQEKEQSKLDREERNERAMLELANLVAELKGEL